MKNNSFWDNGLIFRLLSWGNILNMTGGGGIRRTRQISTVDRSLLNKSSKVEDG